MLLRKKFLSETSSKSCPKIKKNPPPIIACSTELLLLPPSSSLESTSGRRRGSNKCLYARKGTFWKWEEWGGGGGQFCLGRWKRNEGEGKKRPNEIGQQRLLHHPRLWVRLEESCFFPPSPCVCNGNTLFSVALFPNHSCHDHCSWCSFSFPRSAIFSSLHR